MRIKHFEAPHIRHGERTVSLMLDMVIMLLLLYGMAFFYYGPRALVLGVLSVASCLLADLACILMRRSRVRLRDLSAVVTGLILPLLMPASVPYHVVVAAALFAILVAKHPFGGVGNNIFNPAAAGMAFAVICFGNAVVFSYPSPLGWLPVFGKLEAAVLDSPASVLNLGGAPRHDLLDMAMGNFPGPMGATNILVILACLLFLIFRRTVRWITPVTFLAAVSAFAFLFPRANVTGLQSVAYELMSGMLLFGGAFLLGDPVTTPKRGWSKAAFGLAAGVVVMIFRRYGELEDSLVFALLLMNAMVWAFDMLGEHLASLVRRKRFESFDSPKVQKKI